MTISNILAGVNVGGFTALAIITAEAVITGGSKIPLESAIGVGVFACGLVWWMGRKFQSIEDKLEAHARTMSQLQCVRLAGCDLNNKQKD